MRSFLTLLFSLAMFLNVSFAVDAWEDKSYLGVIWWGGFALLFIKFIVDLWYKSPKKQQEEEFFERKFEAVKYVMDNKKGSKEEFCQEHGDEMYDHCLNEGIIHELLDSDPNDARWEATRLAFFYEVLYDESEDGDDD